MTQPEVVLEKKRDFSEVFNASFSFITQEIKGLLKVLIYFGGIPILASVIVSAFYTQNAFQSVISVIQGGNPNSVSLVNPVMMVVTLFLSIFVYLVLSGLIAAYMGVYLKEGHSGLTIGQVWSVFISKLGLIIWFSIVTGILTMLGFIIFLIPGVFISVPFSFVVMVLVIEEKSLGQTMSRCFELVKSHWWITFAIIIVAYLIINVLSFLFAMPATIIGAVKGFLVASGKSTGDINATGITLATMIGNLGSYLVFPIFFVVIGMQYFNLKEQKDMDELHRKVSVISEDV